MAVGSSSCAGSLQVEGLFIIVAKQKRMIKMIGGLNGQSEPSVCILGWKTATHSGRL